MEEWLVKRVGRDACEQEGCFDESPDIHQRAGRHIIGMVWKLLIMGEDIARATRSDVYFIFRPHEAKSIRYTTAQAYALLRRKGVQPQTRRRVVVALKQEILIQSGEIYLDRKS